MMNPILDCAETQERLPLYVGSDLDPDVLRAVEAHLAECPTCVSLADTAGRARSAFRTSLVRSGEETSSPSLWSGVRAQLLDEGLIGPGAMPAGDAPGSQATPPPSISSGRPKARPALRLVRYAGGLAAAAAVVLFFTVGRGGLTNQPLESREVLEGSDAVFVAEPELADPERTPDREGALEKVEYGDDRLIDSADPMILRRVGPGGALAPDGASLAGHR